MFVDFFLSYYSLFGRFASTMPAGPNCLHHRGMVGVWESKANCKAGGECSSDQRASIVK